MIAILSTAHGEGRGAETVLEHLLNGWERMDDAPLIIAPANSRVLGVAARRSMAVMELATAKDALRQNIKAVRRGVSSLQGCRLVHAWHSRGFELAWWLGRRLRVPACGTVHDHPKCSTHSTVRRGLIRFFGSRLTELVCVSEAVRKAWADTKGRSRMCVVRNGLVEHTTTRAASDRVRVGFLGMYAGWKGFDIVEGWIRELSSANIEWRLYGTVAGCWERLVRGLMTRHAAEITLCGEQPAEKVFSEIDLMVHASTEFDPLPTVLIEAARAGVPVVASNLGGGREIVEHGESGFLFDVAVAGDGCRFLQRLVRSASLREEVGRAARQRYKQNFPVSRMIEGYVDIWNRLAGTRD